MTPDQPDPTPDRPAPVRILLADDHAVLRAGLRALLDAEPDLAVVGEAATGEEAVARARALAPDVVVLDLSMPGGGGLEATRALAALEPRPRILVLTMHAEEEFLLPVLEAGGSGYVRKTHADEELTRAIRAVARDEIFLYPSATKLLLEGFREGEGREPDPLERLSGRERAVLARTAEGFTASEIAEQLDISPKTVDTYRARLMVKLGLSHRSELVRFALRTGVLRAE